MTDIISTLDSLLEQRKTTEPGGSYVSSLYAAGLNKILEKVGEEATETIIAAKDCQTGTGTRDSVVSETADLWFHSMVMLSHLNISATEVMKELERRFGTSGLAEKAARQQDLSATRHADK